MKLVIQVLEVVFVLVKVGQRVCQTGDARRIKGYFYLIPALRDLKNDTTYLGVKMILDLVVTPKKRTLV